MALSEAQIKVRQRVWMEAVKPPQADWEDEDTVVFSRTELKALWSSILADAQRHLSEAEVDVIYGMLTQRLFMREDDPERDIVKGARTALYPHTSAFAEAQAASKLTG